MEPVATEGAAAAEAVAMAQAVQQAVAAAVTQASSSPAVAAEAVPHVAATANPVVLMAQPTGGLAPKPNKNFGPHMSAQTMCDVLSERPDLMHHPSLSFFKAFVSKWSMPVDLTPGATPLVMATATASGTPSASGVTAGLGLLATATARDDKFLTKEAAKAAKAAKAAAAEAKEAKASEPKPPKKPSNQYACFVAQSQATVKAEMPQLAQPELMRLLGERWKAMDDTAREPFLQAAVEDNTRYREAYQKYKEVCEAAGVEPVKEAAPMKKEGDETPPVPKKKRASAGEDGEGKKRKRRSEGEGKEADSATGMFENTWPADQIDLENMVGATLLVKWPEYGWLQGVVTEKNEDPEEKDERGDVVNWFVEYKDDDSEAGHALKIDDYNTKQKAKNWSWCRISAADP